MRLLVISSAPIVHKVNQNYLYAPYEKEMQLWAKHADTIQFCCPIWKEDRKLLIAPISFEIEAIHEIQEFDSTSFSNKLKAIPLAILALIKIFKAIQQADHIHLRCPGNIALLACFVQILFPKKVKTAKYAGNWDPKAKQPWSYRLQKWLLSNTFLTRNMQVLVYGEWPNQTKNVKPFFTATYAENDKQEITTRSLDVATCFLFVGTLAPGKQPLYAIQLVEKLYSLGKNVVLELYGEGALRKELERYIQEKQLQEIVYLKGNQTKESVEKAYKKSHFLILPSKSEGWPKVVAEAMFWGCVPLVSNVSCISYIINEGERGILLTESIEQDLRQVESLIQDKNRYESMSKYGINWSRQFTTDRFEKEIIKLLISFENH